MLSALQIMRNGSLLIRDIEAYFARHSLSQLRFLTMILIGREPERDSLSASEIAERLDVSRSVVTRTLQNLGESGLFAISDNSTDARSRNVALTPTGESKLHEVLPEYFAILHRAMSGSEN